jgi:hypothetical protein
MHFVVDTLDGCDRMVLGVDSRQKRIEMKVTLTDWADPITGSYDDGNCGTGVSLTAEGNTDYVILETATLPPPGVMEWLSTVSGVRLASSRFTYPDNFRQACLK